MIFVRCTIILVAGLTKMHRIQRGVETKQKYNIILCGGGFEGSA